MADPKLTSISKSPISAQSLEPSISAQKPNKSSVEQQPKKSIFKTLESKLDSPKSSNPKKTVPLSSTSDQKKTVPPSSTSDSKKTIPSSLPPMPSYSDMNKGLTPSFENVVSVLTLITPLSFGLYFIMASVFNKDIKAIIYIAGILIGTIIIWLPLVLILRHKSYVNESAYCKVINIFPFLGAYNVPSYSSYFISFTAAYLIIPMIKNNDMNIWVLALMLIVLGIDSIVKLKQRCTTTLGIFLGVIIGLIWSSLWVILFMYLSPELLYFDMINGTKTVCNMPTKRQFKCQLYRNGKPDASSTIPWWVVSNN